METIQILLVHEEKYFANTLADTLAQHEYLTEVTTYENLAINLQEQKPDIVILDTTIAGADNLRTIQEIRRIAPLTEILVLGSSTCKQQGIEAMYAGAFDMEIKPIDTEEFVKKVNNAYERKQQQLARIELAKKIRNEGMLLVLGKENDFSQELIDYAVEMATRMSFSILALNAAGFTQGKDLLPQQVFSDFQERSKQNAEKFRQAADKQGVPFAHMVKFNEEDSAIQEIQNDAEIDEIDFVVSEPEEQPHHNYVKRAISVYSLI